MREHVRRPIVKWIVLLAILLILLPCLLWTPAGPWLARGMGGLWEGLLNLPGLAWARAQMQEAAQVERGGLRATSTPSGPLNEALRAGHELQEQGKLEEALRRYRAALEIDKDYAPTHVSLASVYLQLGREDDALKELERAAELAPNEPFILGRLGQLYLNREQFDKAVAVLERARDANPGDAEIRSWLGAAYYYRSYNDPEKAVAELEKAAELAPEDADSHRHLALAYVRRDNEGDRERAIRSLEKCLQLDPKQSEAHYYLGQLYARGGEWAKARAAWQRYVEVGEDAERVQQARAWLRSLQEGAGVTPEPSR